MGAESGSVEAEARELLALVGSGESIEHIARALGLSVDEVRALLGVIFERFLAQQQGQRDETGGAGDHFEGLSERQQQVTDLIAAA